MSVSSLMYIYKIQIPITDSSMILKHDKKKEPDILNGGFSTAQDKK